MNDNACHSPFRQQPPNQPWHRQPPRPYVREDTLRSGLLPVERKTFLFLLKENPRGRLLRIIEEGGKFRQGIIIPASGLKVFQELLEEMIEAAKNLSPPDTKGSH